MAQIINNLLINFNSDMHRFLPRYFLLFVVGNRFSMKRGFLGLPAPLAALIKGRYRFKKNEKRTLAGT
jgi:hypothetical protein